MKTANSDTPELTSAGGGGDWNNGDDGKDNVAGVGIKLDDDGRMRMPSSDCALTTIRFVYRQEP
ncbi:hypothetical protein GGP41_001020 [Bipolaris sorokiniana]|uniref:Uncharacterized protein n=1 Tax=Cochliobolus sativus TaxID=45130 RepID=A0A8H5ZN02_COCSA|nr:hypothetical protein GGP41_001020 [Bipolaris sorokiniana]